MGPICPHCTSSSLPYTTRRAAREVTRGQDERHRAAWQGGGVQARRRQWQSRQEGMKRGEDGAWRRSRGAGAAERVACHAEVAARCSFSTTKSRIDAEATKRRASVRLVVGEDGEGGRCSPPRSPPPLVLDMNSRDRRRGGRGGASIRVGSARTAVGWRARSCSSPPSPLWIFLFFAPSPHGRARLAKDA